MPKKKLDPIPEPIYSGVTCNPENGFVQGLPLKDMAIEEWEALPEGLRAVGLMTGVYTLMGGIDPIEVNPVDEALAIEEAA
jgi:hypothetical protein